MQGIPSKSDSTAGANGVLPASEYNDRNVEIEKLITKSNQTLSAGITDQLSKAVFINAIGAASMIDSGSGNTITLAPFTGGSGLVPPDAYEDFNGGVVCFNKADPNTGTAVTIAPFGLSAKSLVRKDGSLPLAGDVIGTCFCKWDNSADKWILLRNETDSYGYEISASGPVVPKFSSNVVEIDVSVGNVDIDALSLSDFLGQHVHFYAVGSGIASIAGGNGVYVNDIFITANTGGAHLWGVSGGLWKADNGVTADFVSGVDILKYQSDGNLVQIILYTQATAIDTNSVTITYPVTILDVESLGLDAWGQDRDNGRQPVRVTLEYRTSESLGLSSLNITVIAGFSGGSGSSGGFSVLAEIGGKY